MVETETPTGSEAPEVIDNYFDVRFPFDPRRDTVWKEVCRFLQRRYVAKDARILDMGAAYCNFINNIEGSSRHALDIADIIERHAEQGVETHIGSCTDLSRFDDESFDVVFASNLFEHLSLEDLSDTLRGIRRILAPGGQLIALQPNFRYCYKTYFDDYTHTHAYTHASLADLMEACGYEIVEVIPRLLPVNMKESLRLGMPMLDLVVRLYLMSPIRPLAAQMLAVVRKPLA